jgi:hypothetical protein
MYINRDSMQVGLQVNIPSIKSGILKISDGGVSVPAALKVGMTSGVWSGAYQGVSIPVINTYYQVSMTSVTSGELPDGITDNNDGSFTNNTGGTIKIIDRICVYGYLPSGQAPNVALGYNSGGSDTVVLSNSGMYRVIAGAMGGAMVITTYSMYSWPNGYQIFPMIKNISGTSSFNLASIKHSIDIVG